MTKSKQELLDELHLELQHYKRYQNALIALKSQMLLCEERIWNYKKDLDKLEREETPVRVINGAEGKLNPWKVLGIEREEWYELLKLKGTQNGLHREKLQNQERT